MPAVGISLSWRVANFRRQPMHSAAASVTPAPVSLYSSFRSMKISCRDSSKPLSHDNCCSSSDTSTWTPKVCRIIAFWAIFRGFGPLFYLLWGFRCQSSLILDFARRLSAARRWCLDAAACTLAPWQQSAGSSPPHGFSWAMLLIQESAVEVLKELWQYVGHSLNLW